MTQIAPVGWYRGIDADGNPLAGGKLYTYEAGTSTPKATYTTKAGDIANANPVVLDADGYADVWLDTGGYKFRLENAAGVLQRETDNIDGGDSIGFANEVVLKSSNFSLGIAERNQVLVCTAALTISLLPVATAGDGFTSVIVNRSSGSVTIDPDASELINGASTLVITTGNSAIISTNGTAWYAYAYTQTEIADNIFRVVDNADITKKIAFEASGITTATTRTLTAPNKSGTLQLTPSRTLYTTGSGTYTVPTGTTRLLVRMVGGGGGGHSGTGSTGGTTSFGSINAVGGTGATGDGGIGGTGGTGSATLRIAGSKGGDGSSTATHGLGGNGGGTPFGSGPGGRFSSASGSSTNGNTAAANTGSGGGGGVGLTFTRGGGGGGGEYVEIDITSPSATYSYAVGAGGLGANGVSGGDGGSGIIIIEEY